MSEITSTPGGTPPEQPDVPGLPPGAPDAVVRAAAGQGETLTGKDERDALDWFLGATLAPEYDLPVQWDTPQGLKRLTFHLRAQDARKLEEIDARNRKGDGPFAKLDTTTFAAELVAEATVYVTADSGRRVEPNTMEFMGGAPSPAIAMELRFKYQPGVLDGIAEEIRKLSGYNPDRIGTATRALVEAGKPS